MSTHHCYRGMEYSDRRAEMSEWAPLVIEGRDDGEPIAATRMATGADVDYGALTRLLTGHLAAQSGFSVHYRQHVEGLDRNEDGSWRVRHARCGHASDSHDERQIRIHRCRRRRNRTAAEIEDSRRTRLRRLSGQRHLAALRRRRDQRAASREGVRQSRTRFSSDVGSASRHAYCPTASGRCYLAPMRDSQANS